MPNQSLDQGLVDETDLPQNHSAQQSQTSELRRKINRTVPELQDSYGRDVDEIRRESEIRVSGSEKIQIQLLHAFLRRSSDPIQDHGFGPGRVEIQPQALDLGPDMGIENAVGYGDEIVPRTRPRELSVEKQLAVENPGGFESLRYDADLHSLFDRQEGENILDSVVGKIARNVSEVLRLVKPPGSLLRRLMSRRSFCLADLALRSSH